MRRRRFLSLSAAAIAAEVMPVAAQQVLPAHDLGPLIAQITGGAVPRSGRVKLDLPALAENGHSVPCKLTIASPMSEVDHVKSVHLFAERNPRPLVAAFYLGPSAGRAELAARLRLAGTQRVVAVAAMSDGSFWSGETEVVVTSAACIDELT